MRLHCTPFMLRVKHGNPVRHVPRISPLSRLDRLKIGGETLRRQETQRENNDGNAGMFLSECMFEELERKTAGHGGPFSGMPERNHPSGTPLQPNRVEILF